MNIVYDVVAQKALRCYDFSENAEVELCLISENITYIIKEKDIKKAVLRISRPDYHTYNELCSEIKWLYDIERDTQISVAMPVRGKNKEAIQKINLSGTDYYCIMFEYLKGREPDLDENDKSELLLLFEKIGEITAVLHNQAKGKYFLENVPRIEWNFENILGDNAKWGMWDNFPDISDEQISLFNKVTYVIKKCLSDFPLNSETYGLIHSDLRLANLIVDNEKVRLIDFDDCGYGYYIYDLAASLSFIEHREYVPELIEKWLKGYEKIRKLSEMEIKYIPVFIMMRRLQLMAWLAGRTEQTSDSVSSLCVGYLSETEKMAKIFMEKVKLYRN